jgi:hypothetical protein
MLLKTGFLFNYTVYKNSDRTSQETHWLMLCKETAAVYCENHTEYTNKLCGQNARLEAKAKH